MAVVGGGLAGLSAALELAERGFSVTLLEARELGFGASGRNGGQAIHGLACDQVTIEEQLGLDEAKRVWAMSIEALDLLRQRISRYDIDCDWRDGYLGLATNARKGRELQDWAERMEQVYGYAQQHIRAGADAAMDRQRALPQRRVRCALGPPASAEVHAGPGPRGRGRRRDDP